MSLRTALVVSLLALLPFAAGGAAAPQPKQRQKPPCCLNNPRYAGSCVVEPGPEESCGGVLAYLNNPKGVGKTYCNNSTLRGGWKAVRCKPARGSD
jgi:hypothetical protein